MALSISGSSPSFSSYQGGVLTSGTAVASTSGTSITFSSIPSWVKRINVLFNSVSTNGSGNLLVQIGSGSTSSSGYTSMSTIQVSSTGTVTSTAGFIIRSLQTSAQSSSGIMTLALVGSNTWTESHALGDYTNALSIVGGGQGPALGGALDRVIITTTNGTDTFDAGTVNIFYE